MRETFNPTRSLSEDLSIPVALPERLLAEKKTPDPSLRRSACMVAPLRFRIDVPALHGKLKDRSGRE